MKKKDKNWDFPTFIVRQQLIDTRGWNESLIDKFLVPDRIEVNPHNSEQMMRLYSQTKVFAAEASEPFKNQFIRDNWEKLTPEQRIYVRKEETKFLKEKRREHDRDNAFKRISYKKPRDYEKELEKMGLL